MIRLRCLAFTAIAGLASDLSVATAQVSDPYIKFYMKDDCTGSSDYHSLAGQTKEMVVTVDKEYKDKVECVEYKLGRGEGLILLDTWNHQFTRVHKRKSYDLVGTNGVETVDMTDTGMKKKIQSYAIFDFDDDLGYISLYKSKDFQDIKKNIYLSRFNQGDVVRMTDWYMYNKARSVDWSALHDYAYVRLFRNETGDPSDKTFGDAVGWGGDENTMRYWDLDKVRIANAIKSFKWDFAKPMKQEMEDVIVDVDDLFLEDGRTYTRNAIGTNQDSSSDEYQVTLSEENAGTFSVTVVDAKARSSVEASSVFLVPPDLPKGIAGSFSARFTSTSTEVTEETHTKTTSVSIDTTQTIAVPPCSSWTASLKVTLTQATVIYNMTATRWYEHPVIDGIIDAWNNNWYKVSHSLPVTVNGVLALKSFLETNFTPITFGACEDFEYEDPPSLSPYPTEMELVSPTIAPTEAPTPLPTPSPSLYPTSNPSIAPSKAPSPSPSLGPSVMPSKAPTPMPTEVLSPSPSLSSLPSLKPSSDPSSSTEPSTSMPATAPFLSGRLDSTTSPSDLPSPNFDLTSAPSELDNFFRHPTSQPSSSPSQHPTTETPSAFPTAAESHFPTLNPTTMPTESLSAWPTVTESYSPTLNPSTLPTEGPSTLPTAVQSLSPTLKPTTMPTEGPSTLPTVVQSLSPTLKPTTMPTESPSTMPTAAQSLSPTLNPTAMPTEGPSTLPTVVQSLSPTVKPTTMPTESPSTMPTAAQSLSPTLEPTTMPTEGPSTLPTAVESLSPTFEPTTMPTEGPSTLPTYVESLSPTLNPTTVPTEGPSTLPTEVESLFPTLKPTAMPTEGPSTLPTEVESLFPTLKSTTMPTEGPSTLPTAVDLQTKTPTTPFPVFLTSFPSPSPSTALPTSPAESSTNSPTSIPTEPPPSPALPTPIPVVDLDSLIKAIDAASRDPANRTTIHVEARVLDFDEPGTDSVLSIGLNLTDRYIDIGCSIYNAKKKCRFKRSESLGRFFFGIEPLDVSFTGIRFENGRRARDFQVDDMIPVGGAVTVSTESASDWNVAFSGCDFDSNFALYYGGGLSAVAGGDGKIALNITESLFTGNSARTVLESGDIDAAYNIDFSCTSTSANDVLVSDLNDNPTGESCMAPSPSPSP